MIGIAAKAAVSQGRVGRVRTRLPTASELREVTVRNPGGAEKLLERFPGEMRVPARSGDGADIGNTPDTVRH
jgi:hypothetical protein